MRIVKVDAEGDVCSVVTEQKGTWRWQDAYRLAHYLPVILKNGKHAFKSTGRGSKMAYIKRNKWMWRVYGSGSLHHRKIIRTGMDDYGTQFFVTE